MPLQPTNSSVAPQEVNQRVHEIMQHHLTAACNPGMPLSPAAPPGLLGVCASLRVLTTLEPYAPEYVARFTPLLVKLLNRVARDHASPGGLVLDPTRQPRGPRHAPCAGYIPLSLYFLGFSLCNDQGAKLRLLRQMWDKLPSHQLYNPRYMLFESL